MDKKYQDLIDENNADNLRRMKAWIKKCFKEDLKYPDVFRQDMDTILLAAKELKKELRDG
jgi:hypothetical protein